MKLLAFSHYLLKLFRVLRHSLRHFSVIFLDWQAPP